MIIYYILVEPTLGETTEQPGGLFRAVRDDGGFRIELLTGHSRWEDRTALLSPYVMAGEPGAYRVDAMRAQVLEMAFPWPHVRHFKSPV